jgi:hypothetical protein
MDPATLTIAVIAIGIALVIAFRIERSSRHDRR